MADAPIKVVHLITLLELGGAQGNTIHTVKNLNPARFKAYLWCGKGAYWDATVAKEIGGNHRLKFFERLVRPISPLNDLIVLFQLKSALSQLKPTILHTHSSKAGILGRIAGRLAKVPIIIHTYHGFGFNNQQKSWTRSLFISLERFVSGFSKKLIFVSYANEKEAQAKLIGKKNQYVLIRSGIPLREIKERAEQANGPAIKSQLGFKPESKVVTTIGAFKPQKNLTDFVEVAKHFRTVDGVQFLIIGDGEERTLIQKKISESGLREKVKLVGWRRDIPELLSITDIFAMTSLWEGLPRALVEALSLSIPSVCYDTDGVKDLLSQGGGTIIPQKRPDLMVQTLKTILKDNDSKSTYFKNFRYQIFEEFDIDGMVRRQESLYEKLLSNQKAI